MPNNKNEFWTGLGLLALGAMIAVQLIKGIVLNTTWGGKVF